MSERPPCVKTPKGIEEVEQRTWRLPMRARQVLIMIDGKRDPAMLAAMFPGDGLADILKRLLDEGFIAPLPPARPARDSGGRPSAAAPLDADARFRMARNFMVNTTTAFIGVTGSSLITRLEACADLAALRHHFQAWREAIQLARDGRQQLGELESKLAALLS